MYEYSVSHVQHVQYVFSGPSDSRFRSFQGSTNHREIIRKKLGSKGMNWWYFMLMNGDLASGKRLEFANCIGAPCLMRKSTISNGRMFQLTLSLPETTWWILVWIQQPKPSENPKKRRVQSPVISPPWNPYPLKLRTECPSCQWEFRILNWSYYPI